MKIQGPNKSSSTSSTKKSSKAKSGDGGFSDFINSVSGGGKTSQTSAPSSVARVDALLAAQSTEDPTERAARGRMVSRAENVLDELEGLHTALINNNVSIDRMVRIADKVSAHKERVNDGKLKELLEEIDLRAQIELAKMKKALNNS